MSPIALSSSPRHQQPFAGGFTLQEMLVTLAISSTLVTGGASFHATLNESRKTAAVNELMAHLSLARSEAITRRIRVSVCPSKDQLTCLAPEAKHAFWQHGWLLYTDTNANRRPEPAEIVAARQGFARDLVIRTARARDDVTYQPTGTTGGATITFALCDARGPKFARYVTVNNTGRARVSRTTDSAVRCS